MSLRIDEERTKEFYEPGKRHTVYKMVCLANSKKYGYHLATAHQRTPILAMGKFEAEDPYDPEYWYSGTVKDGAIHVALNRSVF